MILTWRFMYELAVSLSAVLLFKYFFIKLFYMKLRAYLF